MSFNHEKSGYNEKGSSQTNYGYQATPAYAPSPSSSYQEKDKKGVSGASHDPAAAPSKYNDVWAAVLFVLQFVFVLVCAVNILSNEEVQVTGANEGKAIFTLKTMLLAAAVSGLMTIAYMFLALHFPMELITGTYLTIIGLSIAFALGGFVLFEDDGKLIVGGLWSFVALVNIFVYMWLKPRIPFAALMLKTSVGLLNRFKKLLFFPVVGGILSLFYCVAAFIVGFKAINSLSNSRSDNSNTIWLIIFAVTFSMFWTIGVFSNIGHVTVSGTFASYLFAADKSQLRDPVMNSFRRAVTWSFGSICLGSMFLALIQTVRVILKSMKDERRQNLGNLIINCLLTILENLVCYFNVYAFTQVAIYGKSYIQAAKDTWSLIKSHGIDAIWNDCIVSRTLSFGMFFVALASCGITALLLQSNTSQGEGIFLSLAFGFFFMCICTGVIQSGIVAMFVCLCEDSDAIQQSQPDFYRGVSALYPGVVAKV